MAKKKHGFISVALVILFVLLMLALAVRFLSPFYGKITVTLNGKALDCESTELIISSEDKFIVKSRTDYEIKIYARELDGSDFMFTADGKTYSWNADVIKARGGTNTDITDGLKIERNGKEFYISGSIGNVLRDMYDSEIILFLPLPSGDKFRMEITNKKETFTFGFDLEYAFVSEISLSPEILVF